MLFQAPLFDSMSQFVLFVPNFAFSAVPLRWVYVTMLTVQNITQCVQTYISVKEKQRSSKRHAFSRSSNARKSCVKFYAFVFVFVFESAFAVAKTVII